MKPTYLMSATTLKDINQVKYDHWIVSEKLNGHRCFWDGGISRGLRMVPWASRKPKNGCTGLWSRWGHPIYAPTWFLDALPKDLLLDGELFDYSLTRQEITSAVKKHNPNDGEWKDIKFYVFASPLPRQVFAPRHVEYKPLDINFHLEGPDHEFMEVPSDFYECYEFLKSYCDHPIRICEQCVATEVDLTSWEKGIKARGGEGLVFRRRDAGWIGARSNFLLKYKFVEDSEGVVIDYELGKGKLEGMMGALWVEENGLEFKISGFTNEQRRLVNGWPVHFPKGKLVNFTFSGRSTKGVPQEARFNSEVIA